MSKFNDLTGLVFGCLTVIKRGPNYDNGWDGKTQFYCSCSKCGSKTLVSSRDLKRYKERFNRGCRDCTDRPINNKNTGVRYGRNINGFIDRSIIISGG